MESKLLRPGTTKKSIRSSLFYPWHISKRLPSISAISITLPRRISSPTYLLILESNLRATMPISDAMAFYSEFRPHNSAFSATILEALLYMNIPTSQNI
jgi:hypothetical protein